MSDIVLFIVGVVCGCALTLYIMFDLPLPFRHRGLNKPAEIVKPPALTRYDQPTRIAKLRELLDDEMREHDEGRP